MNCFLNLTFCAQVFKGMYPLVKEFYFLFQHHTTLDKAKQECDMFGSEMGFSTLHLIDDGSVAIVGLDTRSERNANQVIR
jgi:hypothetical protein